MRFSFQDIKNSIEKWSPWTLAKGLVGVGIILRIIQFLVNRGLREEESHLSINFVRRDLLGMLQPLDHGQVAPPLFLIIEKISMTLFGQNEFSLRYFALLSSCAALFLFYKFLREHTNPWITVMGVGMMAVNRSIIFFAVAVKQYSSDLFVNILLFYILFNENISQKRKYTQLTIIGGIAIWLSHTAVFILFAIGLYLFILFIKSDLSDRIRIMIAGVVWIVSFGSLYFATIAHHPNEGIMLNYWNEHFMPLFPTTRLDWMWYFNHFRDTISFSLGFSNKHYILWVPYGISFLLGMWYCFKKKEYKFLLWILVPILIHLIISGGRIYPFYHRLILYLIFPISVFISFGMYQGILYVQEFFSNSKFLKPFIMGLLLLLLVVGLSDFPYPTEDIKQSLKVVNKNFQPGDKIFVYYSMDAAFEFYRKKYVSDNVQIYYAVPSRNNYSNYDEQIKVLNGRIWFVFAHIYKNETGKKEDNYIIHTAEKRGNILMCDSSYNASVYLMDFDLRK